MYTKTLCLSCDKSGEILPILAKLKGVESACLGMITPAAETDTVLGLMVVYNPKQTDISTLLDEFFSHVNPYVPPQKAEPPVIYYETAEDLPQIELYLTFLAALGKSPQVGSHSLTINDTAKQALSQRRSYASCKRLAHFEH